MSMFGGFGRVGFPQNLGQGIVVGSPGPGGFGGQGGFPGVFPAGGVSNSGFAGLAPQATCTKDDLKTGRCVLGPMPWAGH